MATTSELLDRFVSLFNAGKFEEGEQDYAPNGVAEEVGTNRRMTPKEATEGARAWKQAFPDAIGTITNKIVDGNKGAAEIILAHHERWDGKGYPNGLEHEGVPLGARIFMVCDTFDSMTSDRPYRKALTAIDAMNEPIPAGPCTRELRRLSWPRCARTARTR